MIRPYTRNSSTSDQGVERFLPAKAFRRLPLFALVRVILTWIFRQANNQKYVLSINHLIW